MAEYAFNLTSKLITASATVANIRDGLTVQIDEARGIMRRRVDFTKLLQAAYFEHLENSFAGISHTGTESTAIFNTPGSNGYKILVLPIKKGWGITNWGYHLLTADTNSSTVAPTFGDADSTGLTHIGAIDGYSASIDLKAAAGTTAQNVGSTNNYFQTAAGAATNVLAKLYAVDGFMALDLASGLAATTVPTQSCIIEFWATFIDANPTLRSVTSALVAP